MTNTMTHECEELISGCCGREEIEGTGCCGGCRDHATFECPTCEEEKEAETKKAFDFLGTMRGRYIVSQALYYGIKSLSSVQPDAMQEKSNIADMKFLKTHLFDFPDDIFKTTYEHGTPVGGI